MAQSFRDLLVWQRSMQLAAAIYRLTRDFPREEMFGLTSQLRRAAVSIPSNIAEGHGRLSRAEFRQFLGVSRGSNFELQTQVEIARGLEYGDPLVLLEVESMSHEVGKMIFALLGSVNDQIRQDRELIAEG